MSKRIVVSDIQKINIIKSYENGESISSITKEFDVSRHVVERLLNENSVKLRPCNRKIFFKEDIFEKIDSAEKAYWIGFILADGYIHEKRHTLRIKLGEVDYDHLVKFANFMGVSSDRVFAEIHNVTGNTLYKVEFNSKILVNSLMALNLFQGKSSGKEKLSPIPDEYVRDYIRGIWDGDGHLREKNIDVISSIEVLSFIQIYLHDKCYTKIGKIMDHCNTYRIYVCRKEEVSRTLKHLYYDGCISLDRKYNTAKKLIEILPS